MSRRYSKRSAYAVKSILILLLALIAVLSRAFFPDEELSETPDGLKPGLYQVERVIDGDTFVLTNQTRIRLLGVDTPETKRVKHPQPWGPQASEFTKQFVAGGRVRLEFDDHEKKDRYDRVLAYVWVGDEMLNEKLLKFGLGKFLSQYPYDEAKKKIFRQAEQEAKAARRGIWSQ